MRLEFWYSVSIISIMPEFVVRGEVCGIFQPLLSVYPASADDDVLFSDAGYASEKHRAAGHQYAVLCHGPADLSADHDRSFLCQLYPGPADPGR